LIHLKGDFAQPSMQTKPSILPYFGLLGGIVCLSFSALFLRWSEAPAIVTAFYRMLIAGLALTPFLIARKGFRQIKINRVLLFPLAAGLFTALDHATLSSAVMMTRVANATLLNHIAPMWVALFSAVFLHEVLNRRFWTGLAAILVGVLVVFGRDVFLNPSLSAGDLLALLSSFFYAGYYVVTGRGRKYFDTLPYVWVLVATAAVFLLLFCLVGRLPMTGFSSTTWLVFLGAGIISQIGGYFSISYALGHLPASVVSPSIIASPVLTALLAIPATGESLAILQMVGGLAVLGGIYLVNKSQPANEPTVE
jgi:drug/metabolite transporter (DMT)-like permease